MHKTLILGLALAVAALAPATAVAKPAKKDVRAAKKECQLELRAMGKANFRALNKSMGACVKRTSREEQRERRTARAQAKQQCRAERRDANFAATHGGKTFAEHYGTNKNKSNAFGKCISAAAKVNKTELDAQDADERSAARACRAEQRDAGVFATNNADAAREGKTFSTHYGTETSNYENAFGKCVSRKASARGQARRQQAQAEADAKQQNGTANRPDGAGQPA